jgi:hypothetical protein
VFSTDAPHRRTRAAIIPIETVAAIQIRRPFLAQERTTTSVAHCPSHLTTVCSYARQPSQLAVRHHPWPPPLPASHPLWRSPLRVVASWSSKSHSPNHGKRSSPILATRGSLSGAPVSFPLICVPMNLHRRRARPLLYATAASNFLQLVSHRGSVSQSRPARLRRSRLQTLQRPCCTLCSQSAPSF